MKRPPGIDSTTTGIAARSTTTGTATSTTTSSTLPPRPTSYRIGRETFHWKDSSRTTWNAVDPSAPISGRILTTVVLYPTLGGSAVETPAAKPATSDGPFPVIVLAHGFDVSPSYYQPLLDSWVQAGFIVVSPIFPDENTATVSADGGPYSTGGSADDNDESAETGDIPFVLQQFDAVVATGSGSPLAGIADTSDLALAGQSDGANVVAALAYGSAYGFDRRMMPVEPKAVAILSGQQLIPANGHRNLYAASSSSPAVLQVQSDTDTCNSAQSAAGLFGALVGAPVHLFETLHGATHLAPYTTLFTGTNPWAAVVEKVTTEFFEVELGWNNKGVSIASVIGNGSMAGVSNVTVEAPGFPSASAGEDCSGLPTTGSG